MDRGEAFDTSELFGDCIDEQPDPVEAAARLARRQQAVALRTRTRVHTSRAKSEAVLADLLPPVIASGDSWHVMSAGDVDALSYLAHLLRAMPADHAIVSTWCMSLDDVQQLAAWLHAGQIARLDVYVGETFPSQYGPAFDALCSALRGHPGGGRVAVFRNHAKVTVMANHKRRYYATAESSANLNTNPRNEQTTITRGRPLACFYKTFFDNVRSNIRNFDTWVPHGWQTA